MVKMTMGVDYVLKFQVVVPDIIGQSLFFGWAETARIYDKTFPRLVMNQVATGSQCVEIKRFNLHFVNFVYLPAWEQICKDRNLLSGIPFPPSW